MPIKYLDKPHQVVGSERIWRFISIQALLSTLVTRKLRFTQLRQLNDQWEGVITPAFARNNEELMREIERHFARPVPDQTEDLKIKQLLNRFHNYVSCWTLNSPDSMQMWSSYGDSNEWCAIETTPDALRSSLTTIPEVSEIGLIQYVDPDIDQIQGIDARREIYRKRKAFEYEQEVRFTINTTFKGEGGGRYFLTEPSHLYEDFDISVIEKIVIHPNAPVGTLEMIRKILEGQKVNLEVAESSIARKPPFQDFE